MTKKTISLILLLVCFVAWAGQTYIGQFQVRSSPGIQASSALFEVASTTKGSRPCPPMTTTQRNAITSPVQGLCVTNSDTTKFNIYTGTTWTDIGSGSGGGINYISPNNDAESGTVNWATYADAAGALPVDCTGGAPTVTWTQSSSSPLRDTNSFLYTHPASNTQGQGVAYPFSTATADQAKPLTISFEYGVASGTWQAGSDSVDSDLEPYIYDVTNAVVIQPSGYKLTGGSTGQFKYQGSFQTASNSVSYRLCLHHATTGASAFTIKFDTVSVGPDTKVLGSPVSDWTSYTPVGSWVANTTHVGKWRRVGDSMEILVLSTLTGAPTAAAYTIQLPSGYSIDSAKVNSASTLEHLGTGTIFDATGAGTGKIFGEVDYNTSTTVNLRTVDDASGSSHFETGVDNTNPVTFATGDAVVIRAVIPILGWGSTVILSKDTDTRVVAVQSTSGNNQNVPTSGVDATATQSAVSDTHSGISGTVYIIPIAGWYQMEAHNSFSANATGQRQITIQRSINGGGSFSAIAIENQPASAASQTNVRAFIAKPLNAQDQIRVVLNQTSGGALSTVSDGSQNTMSIVRVSGPDSIAASELIQSRNTTVAGQSIPNNTSTIIDFGTSTYSTHGSVTTGASWKFTAPSPGKYSVKAAAGLIANAGWASGEFFQISIFKNGAIYSTVGRKVSNAGNNDAINTSGSDDVIMNAGDFIDIRALQNNGAAITMSTTAGDNFVSIHRLGGIQ